MGRSNRYMFGFDFEGCGAHTSRTIMFNELETLLSYINNPKATKEEYRKAIEEDNCLGKRSLMTRKLTMRHLSVLYTLSQEIPIFRILRYFWSRDIEGRPLMALLCAYVRDALLRTSGTFILPHIEGSLVTRETLEKAIDDEEPHRFSEATLKSVAQNLNSSWTQSGHLTGRVKKYRVKAKATPGSVSYALVLGYIMGIRGRALFESEFIKLLLNHVGDVVEVLFPNLLTPEEMEWSRE